MRRKANDRDSSYGDELITMKHVVSFSGGIGSWAAAQRVRERHGVDDLILLFADVKMEDEDTYRFLRDAANNIGGEFVVISEGRDPWAVFRDERILTSRLDPCSKLLKRELLDRWIKERFAPDQCVRYIGIDWTEQHRLEAARPRFAPYTVEAPLCEPPLLSKADLIAQARAQGLEPPRLYALGFQHGNCGGFCVKAGQAQFAQLLRTFPERYRYHESKEQELRETLGPNAYILRDRRGGTTKPLTLRDFRLRMEAQETFDKHEWGGCGCGF